MNDIPPLIHTPMTRVTGPLLTYQRSPRCRDFEMRYMECLDAYGIRMGRTKCKDYMEDLRECANSVKTINRFNVMRLERVKQYWKGERKEIYAEPADGSYL